MQRLVRPLTALAFGAALIPTAALACGGLFCNTAQPVNQAAERVLFAVEGDHVTMHVRITYQGPPTDFGWLLPVPRGVVTELSSETLFARLDQNAAPVFQLNTVFEDGCEFPLAAPNSESDSGAGGSSGGEPGVEVLSRQNIGPYDRAILDADAVAPQVAVFQAGHLNRYGHPAQEVLARYRQRAIAPIDSPSCGAWTWRSGSGTGLPHSVCHRVEARRYWHWQPDPQS